MRSSIPILIGIFCLSWLVTGCSSLSPRDRAGTAEARVSQEDPERHAPRRPCDTPDCFLHGHHKHPKLFRYQRYRNPHL